MNISGKVWGTTSLVHKINNVEIHYINIKKGGFCSKHLHTHKFNKFFNINGVLEIEVWKDYGSADLIDVTTLNAGDELTVSPGEFHRFKALTDVIAIEMYWVSLDSEDIERELQGGLKQ